MGTYEMGIESKPRVGMYGILMQAIYSIGEKPVVVCAVVILRGTLFRLKATKARRRRLKKA